MNKLMALLMVLTASGCASRGYNTLALEVPEIFPGFNAENYEKKETPQNIVYVEKTLPENEKSKEEFHEDEYLKKSKPGSYNYYVPQNRVPASLENNLFSEYEKIKTTHDQNAEALLID